jgi:hypothetical protein
MEEKQRIEKGDIGSLEEALGPGDPLFAKAPTAAPGAKAGEYTQCFRLHSTRLAGLWRCDLPEGHDGPCSNRIAGETAPDAGAEKARETGNYGFSDVAPDLAPGNLQAPFPSAGTGQDSGICTCPRVCASHPHNGARERARGVTLEPSFGDPFIWCDGYDHDDVLKSNEWVLIKAPQLNALLKGPITFYDGKKIYDQGWNDGIDHYYKFFMLEAKQRFGRR